MSKHLATLNLFQQPDGTFEITVSSGSVDPGDTPGDTSLKLIDHVENRILAAATRMQQRKRGDGTYRSI